MHFLLVHQNFPGQFKFLAPTLVRRGHDVTAMTMRKIQVKQWQGVKLVSYKARHGTTPDIHPWVRDFESKVIRGEACLRAALDLKKQGLDPDVIIAHHGWGESLFLKEVWPQARLGVYCEYFYQPHGADFRFDPEFPVKDPIDAVCRLDLKNLNNRLHFEQAVAGISPTRWQADTFPEPFRNRISVIHEGIHTDAATPDPNVSLALNTHDGRKVTLTRTNEIITFVNRNLEPFRGYHVFMRALPDLLQLRPDARVIIVGGNEVSYGAPPDPAVHGKKTWKQVFIDEIRPRINDKDWQRVHFVGRIPYTQFIPVLQISTVHVYLTYPFVLSWSLLEAMSCGCAVVASDTPPVLEVIRQGETGRLVDFFSGPDLVNEICLLLDDPKIRERLGKNARRFIRETYDLKTICLPKQLAWAEELGEAHKMDFPTL
jgi:glycosyltransferase involved in cell wall biosynthesis